MMGTRALFTPLLAGLVTLPAMCNVYHSDIGKLCDAEQLSQSSLKASRGQLFTWAERNVASRQGIVLVRNLEAKDPAGIAVELRDEARKVGLTACALADQADMQGKDEDVHTDMVNLCAGSASRGDGSTARLDILSADDAERMREMTAWTSSNAKTPDTRALVAKLAGLQRQQRGTLLRAEAAKVGVTSCLMAGTLDALPPAPGVPINPHQVNPSFMVTKVDAAPKTMFPVAHAIVAPTPQSAINGCYASALGATPKLAGKLAFKFQLDPGGHATKVTDEGSTLKGPVVACVTAAMNTVSIEGPPPDGMKKAKVSVTLQLTPVTSGGGFEGTIEPGLLAKLTSGLKHK